MKIDKFHKTVAYKALQDKPYERLNELGFRNENKSLTCGKESRNRKSLHKKLHLLIRRA